MPRNRSPLSHLSRPHRVVVIVVVGAVALSWLAAGACNPEGRCLVEACACEDDIDCAAGLTCVDGACIELIRAEGEGEGEGPCAIEPGVGLIVTVVDDVTQFRLCDATVTASRVDNPADVFTLGVRALGDGCEYAGPPDRVGVFDVVAAHPDYFDGELRSVEVFADECGHAIDRNVQVTLEPKLGNDEYQGEAEAGVQCGALVCAPGSVCCVSADEATGEIIEQCEVAQCSAAFAIAIACDGPEDCGIDVCCLFRSLGATGDARCVQDGACPTSNEAGPACNDTTGCSGAELCCAVDVFGADVDIGGCVLEQSC